MHGRAMRAGLGVTVTTALLLGVVCRAAALQTRPSMPDRSLFVAQEFGAEPTPLFSHPEFTATGSPDWSPDGTKILMDAWRSRAGDDHTGAHILLIDADGSGFRDLGDGTIPSWSRDGKRIVFSRYSPNNGVWLMDADGSRRERLDARGWSGQWSPDGKTIAYTVFADGGADVCLHDVATGAKRNLFDGRLGYRQIFWNFTWSPDSKRLCFKAAAADGKTEIATVAVDDPAAGVLVHYRGPCYGDPSWHPSGDRILTAIPSDAHDKAYRMMTFPADGSAEPTPLPGLPDEYYTVDGDWSPDGRVIAFAGRLRTPPVPR